ncbi:MAG: hypothetical protein HRT40_10900 [Campylobacteraceae bacterium]|nr:hypothetical protein [Campylobacteraceae bacterium]
MKRSIGMKSSYILTAKSVDYEITKISAGNFALGNESKSGLFVVEYYGRSDTDLNSEIKIGLINIKDLNSSMLQSLKVLL